MCWQCDDPVWWIFIVFTLPHLASLVFKSCLSPCFHHLLLSCPLHYHFLPQHAISHPHMPTCHMSLVTSCCDPPSSTFQVMYSNVGQGMFALWEINQMICESYLEWQLNVSVCISCHTESNCVWSEDFTHTWMCSQSIRNASVQKCDQITQSMCHQQSSTVEPRYTAKIAFICALSQSIIIIANEISGLHSFTKFK